LGNERTAAEYGVSRFAAALAVMLLLAACAKNAGDESAKTADATAVANNPASASDGAVIYDANCSSCHQPDGRGMSGAFPPLAGNPVVTGNPTAVIAIVKNGLDGRVEVNGQFYSGIMPRWKGVLTDEQIAAAISYIRSSWHNRASGVSVSQVEAIK
jgi:mono/diheme cytochrome c family protein